MSKVHQIISMMRRELAATIEERRNIRSQLHAQSPYQIQFYNYGWPSTNEEFYWRRYICGQKLLTEKDAVKIAVFYPFGPRNITKEVSADIKIFITGEDVKKKSFSHWADHGLRNGDVHLALGFEYFEDVTYARFPLWMEYMFMNPQIDLNRPIEDIVHEQCQLLRYPLHTHSEKRSEIFSLVSSHVGMNRDKMYESLSALSQVKCAGKFMHNDDTLQTIYHDNKIDYLSNFLFNICPENANTMGYVTEKLFEAIYAGCIPIYWGSYNNPEPQVLNQNAILFWDMKDESIAVNQIKRLLDYPKELVEFMAQPRLQPHAEEYIMDTFNDVNKKIIKLIDKCSK